MSNNSNFKNDVNDSSPNGDEIDLKIFFNFINRNKKFLSLTAIVFLFFGYLISFIPKRTWEGQFQIVLNSKPKNKNLSKLTPILENFGGLSATNSLKTEVGILESPSVLMPIYEMVISKQDNLSNKNSDFMKWKKKKLSFELTRGTSILNIAYRDKEKNNILPVLERMSNSYQEFSGKRKARIDKLTQDYLETQIKLFKTKSYNSLKAAQEYAIDKDLIYFDSFVDLERIFKRSVAPTFNNQMSLNAPNIVDSIFLPDNVDIENVRVEATNEIRLIDLQLKKIENSNDKSFQYLGLNIPDVIKSEYNESLKQVEVALVEAKSKYTQEDSTIKMLTDRKKIIIDQLKERSINFLKSKKIEAEAIMAAATRPKEVLLKYKELVRNAKRDEMTFLKLENNLRELELKKTMAEVPWELITKPTLLNKPVDNIRIIIFVISLFLGLLIGTIFSLYKEISSGKVFELKELKRVFSDQFIEIVSLKEIKLNSNKVICLKELINKKSNEKINFIRLGDIDENKLQIFKNFLTKDKQFKKEIIFTNSITDAKNEEIVNTNFLILENESVKFSDIKTFKKYMDLFNIVLSGTIILDK